MNDGERILGAGKPAPFSRREYLRKYLGRYLMIFDKNEDKNEDKNFIGVKCGTACIFPKNMLNYPLQ